MVQISARAVDVVGMSPIEKIQHESSDARSFDAALIAFIAVVALAMVLGATGLL